MAGRIEDQDALKILADHFRDTKNETQKQLNNTENQHEQTGQREIEEVRVLQEEDIKWIQKIKEWLKKNQAGA